MMMKHDTYFNDVELIVKLSKYYPQTIISKFDDMF